MKKQSAEKQNEKNTAVKRKASDKRSTAIMILCVSLVFAIILAALIFSVLLPSLSASEQLKTIKEALNTPENIDGFVNFAHTEITVKYLSSNKREITVEKKK